MGLYKQSHDPSVFFTDGMAAIVSSENSEQCSLPIMFPLESVTLMRRRCCVASVVRYS